MTAPTRATKAGEFSSGWPTLVLALAGVATSVSALLIYSLGTLMVPLERGLNWSRADLQIAVSFLAAGFLVTAILERTQAKASVQMNLVMAWSSHWR